MPDLIPANLTPEEQAEFDAKSPTVAPQGQSVLSALSAPELAELSVKDKDNFDLIHEFRNNQDLWQDPAVVQKVADAHNLIRQRGFKFSDLPGPAKVAGQIYDVGKGLAKQAWNYAGAGVNAALGVVAPSGVEDELIKQAQQKVAENFSGTEQAVTGLANMAEKGIKKVFGKNPAQLTPEEKLQDLWTAVGKGETEQDISKGHGAFMQGVGEHVISDLEKEGAGVRPEEVATLTPGDPFSFWAFGKAMGVGGKAISAVTPGIVGKVGQAVSEGAGKLAGKGIEKAGQALQVGAKVTGKVGQTVLPVAGAVEGAIHGGPIGILPGIAGGQVAAKALTKTAAGAEKAGASVEGIGKQVAGAKPVVSPYAQAIKDTAEAVPGALADVGKGVATDIGVAAVTAENPHDTEGVGLGSAIGALHGAARLGTHIVSGQIIAPRAWGSSSASSSSGAFPKLDSMHSDAIAAADPGVKMRLNAVREFAKRTGTDVFLAKDTASLQSALEASGIDPARAAQMADQEGFFTAQLPDSNGQPKRVIVAKNIEAAPHESFHAIQDVLGETANREIDDIVKKAYANEWDTEGQKYAARLGGKGDWRETVLDLSGWGRSEAVEKLFRDTANKVRTETGAEPDQAFVRDRVTADWNQKVADARKANPSATPEELQAKVWRDILTPEEASATADRYLARELAAENFDMVFKHGPQGKSLPERLSRIVAHLTTALGGNPLADRQSDIGQITPKFSVTEAVRKANPSVEVAPKSAKAKPVVTVPTPAAPTPTEPTSGPAEEAKKIAEEAPETLPGRTTSPREVLGTVAEAIAQQTGVKINYHSAPDEPAAAATSNRETRRAIIEVFRDMPKSARALWEKTFFPERVIKTKNDYQVMGWSPEVFAANAHKMAQTLAVVNPKLSPYEIDSDLHTFTDAGWKNLYEDVQRFVKNQMAGSTGAGESLVVPKSVTEKGAYAPPIKPGAASLDQNRADFINLLFNFRLPDTARVQKGRLPLNIVGQEVSEATKPGRTAIPVHPRGMFVGKEADALGIAGRDIKEVNPLRQQIEQEAQAAGKAMPSMIEAIQKLNLENIADVQLAPEAPQFRGNTLTLTAGFQPPSAEVKKSGKEYIERAAIKLKDGQIFTGAAHYQAVDEAVGKKLLAYEDENLADKYTDGFMTNTGRFVDRAEAAKIAQSVGQLAEHSESVQTRPKSLEAHLFNAERQFQPNAMDALKDPEKWKAIVAHPAGKFGGGLTGWAFEQGAKAKQEDLAKFKSTYEMFSDLAKDTIKTGDFEKGMDLMSRAQVAHEAYQMATGKDLQGNDRLPVIRKMIKDPEFQPPLGETTRQTLPSKELDKGQENGHNGSMIQAQPIKANDDVHDIAVGYAKSRGLDAWKAHSEMFTPEAQGALAGETLAQNAWVNFGPQVRGKDIPLAERQFAEQKNISLPQNFIDEARGVQTQAQPPKAEDWQMPDKASNGFKKAWITPDGMPVQLGGQWHHDWLAEHPEYGIKVSGTPSMDEDARVDALKKGFVRINYGQNTGTLVVEARAKDWPKQRDNVRQFVESNLGDIDNLKIALLDPKAGEVIDSNSVKLFNFDDDKKIENVPLLNESASAPRKEIPVAEAATLRPDKSYNPSDSYFQAQPKKPTDQLPGFEKPDAFSSKEIADMTKDELKAHFPEAIVPKKRNESIPSDVLGSPLFKQSGSEEKAVDAFAKKMVDFAKQWEGHPVYDMGKQWYSEFAPMLKKQFGKDAPLMAELLAATSPQTSVETNFGYAHDALESIKSGRFDKLIKKFEQGLSMLEDDRWLGWYNKELNAGNIPEPPAQPTEAAFLEAWIDKHDLKPRQSNGKLYGQHSLPVLQVFARRWLDLAKGPKTRNFVENLLGNGHEATIDLWADRTMRRLGYSDTQQRWRILPQNKAGVSDADFAFAQKVYRKAADELKMNPDDLQGALWFAEKQLWSDNGWGRLDLGDFRKEMEKVPMLRQGYRQRLQKSQAEAKATAEQQLEILPRNIR
jgi:hypothetical protein